MAVMLGVEVLDQDSNAVDGVDIEIFDAAGIFVATGKTGDTSSGRVEFSLTGSENGTVYNIKAYEIQDQNLFAPLVPFIDRKSTLVYEPVIPGTPNDAFFEKNTVLSCSPDPNCCRLTLEAIKLNCATLPGYLFYVRTRRIPRTIHSPTPGGVQGKYLGGDRITLRTDKNGQAVFDLPRNGIFTAVLPDYVDEEIVFEVPDSPCADFTDLIHLYPKSVTYDDTAPAVAVGSTVEVEVTTFLMSNGRSRDVCDVDYLPSEFLEPEVTSGAENVEVTWKPGTSNVLLITGLQAGSATVQLIAKDPSDSVLPARLPKAPVSQTVLTVTVS